MKKEICEQRPFCDVCEKEAVYGCAGCPKDTCLDCRDETFIGYLMNLELNAESVFPVCNDCVAKPPKDLKARLKVVKQIDRKIKSELKRRQDVYESIKQFAEDNFPVV